MNSLRLRKYISLALALLMIFTSWPTQAYASDLANPAEPQANALNANQQEAYEAVMQMGEISGLYGFEEAGVSLETENMVPIIVLFKHNPAQVEAALQQASGVSARASALSLSLEDQAANDKAIFQEGLDRIFGSNVKSFSAFNAEPQKGPYYITAEYSSVINGSAMLVPGNKVAELLAIDSVAAVFYDETMTVEGWMDEDIAVEEGFAGASNKISSTAMEVQLAHARGEYGKGVKVAVVDTGVDYYHPDLKDAFQSWSNWEDIPELYRKEGEVRVHWRDEDQKWVYYGVNAYDMQFYPFTQAPHPYPGIARVDYSGVPGKPANPEMAKWDPLEITHYDWKNGYTGTASFMNNHGTHVSGIIAAQGVFTPNVLGVAPECDLVVYRIGGPGGTGNSAATLMSLEMGIEEGVKIFNYSFGSAGYPGTYGALGIAVNYATLAYDVIWCKSAGNSGSTPRLITGPGGASMSFVSGNGSYAALNVEYNIDGETFSSKLVYTDLATEFVPHLDENNDVLAWTFDGPESMINEDFSHNFFVMPKRVNGNGFEGVGAGEAADWTAKVQELAAGKIVVLARATTESITTIVTRAFNNGAAGLVVIQPASGTQLSTSWGTTNNQMNASYVPTTVIAHNDGLNFVYALRTNKDLGHITSVNGTGTFGLSSSSSRGPVADSYEIKPEVVSPGSSIWSTVPWYNRLGASDETPPINDETYITRGHYTMSGTSMASPFTAGLCALVWGHDLNVNGEFTMKATEVRARLANTANRDIFASQNWGVNEVGGGGSHIGAAIDATSYVTVTKTDIPILRDGKFQSPLYDFGSGEVTSFSFLGSYRGAPTETRKLEANVYNVSDTAKTFTVSYILQTTGTSTHNIKSNGKILPELSTTEVIVGPGSSIDPGKANFTVSLTIPADLEDEDVGSHEGFIILTNVDNPKEIYRLPWSIYIEKGLPEWYLAGVESGEFVVSTYDEWLQLIDIVRGGGGGAAGSAGGFGFRDQFAGKTVKLGADITINLTNTRFFVGTFEWPFLGTFDGNGYSISYRISSTANPPDALSTSYRALFGHVQNATIKNVVINAGLGTVANGTILTSNRSAAIVGMASATEGNQTVIENCVNNAIVTGGSSQVGGIVGLANVADGGKLSIKDCTNNGNITGTTQVGGILGGTLADVPYIANVISGEIELINCVNTGTISNTLDYGIVGGIAGTFTGTKVTMIDCVNEGTINAPASVGAKATLTDIHNAVGGVVGYTLNAAIEAAVNDGVVNNNKLMTAVDFAAQLRTGGIAGFAVNSSINNSVNNGAINTATTGVAEVIGGGIVGVAEGSSISNSLNTADISATDIAKAIAAVAKDSILEENYRLGAVLLNGVTSKVNDPSADDGGLIDALIVKFPGVEGVKVDYYDTAWKTLASDMNDGAFFKMPDGEYTVHVSKGGMGYTFSDVIVDGESVLLEVPVANISVTDIDVMGAKLALVQSNWVYQGIEVGPGEYAFPVFDNGHTYELRITEPGLPTRSIGTANSTTAEGIWAGDTVAFRGQNHYQDIAVTFPGLDGVKVEYYGTSWTTVGTNFKDSANFDLGPGKYTVRVSKGGMGYTFSDVQVGQEGLELNVPILPIAVKGIEKNCKLALVQSDWVYPTADVELGNYEFLVFDNGRTYELRITENGQTRSIGTANSTTAEGIWAGDIIYLSNPEFEEYQRLVKMWNNIYAWASGSVAPFDDIANIYTQQSIEAANNLLSVLGGQVGGAHAQAIRDANNGQAGPPYWLNEDHPEMLNFYQEIKNIVEQVEALLVVIE